MGKKEHIPIVAKTWKLGDNTRFHHSYMKIESIQSMNGMPTCT